MGESVDPRPSVVLSANSCWNLMHYRRGLIRGLDRAGFRVIVLAPLDSSASELRRRGIDVWPLSISRSGLNPLADGWLLVRYIRLLQRLRPTAYCGFTIKPNIYGSIGARLLGVPTINNVTGVGSSFLSEGWVWTLVQRLYRSAFRRSRKVFFQNSDDAQMFLRRGIVRAQQTGLIPGSGVDLQYFNSAGGDSGEQGRSPIFLYIGRLIAHKGIREFTDAARALRQVLPAARFQLLGDRDPGNPTSVTVEELRMWVKEGVVEHLGEHKDVRPFIRSATAVVLPSYREGMSRALLEAAAMGKPLIGSNVPGVRELIEEGVNGALCEPRDARSLAKAIERIGCLSAFQLRSFGLNSRDKVEHGFSEDIVVNAYLNVLAEVH